MAQSSGSSVAVYKVHPVTLGSAVFAALLLQSSLPLLFPLGRLFDFPLLAVIYFALLKRHRAFGALLGMAVGLLQDALSHGYIGMFGMAKTLVGYLAAWGSVKFNLEHIFPRFVLTGALIAAHGLAFFVLRHALLEASPPFEGLDSASSIMVNLALALAIFPLLDRFRRPA